MTPENFAYWLKGWVELQNPTEITKEQLQIIQDHLNLVFRKETPQYEEAKYFDPPMFPQVTC